MDFAESIRAHADHVQKLKSNLKTEEATKTGLIMPFINLLGYNVFNPLEVIPEFTADVADRRGEKVDYAIMHEGKPIIIVECKCCGSLLDSKHCEQLHRYFTTLDTRIAILTDGVRYLFFSDLDEQKRMDSRPFMEFDFNNIDPTLIPELRKLCKGKFDLQTALDTAVELRYNREIKRLLLEQLDNPAPNFTHYFIKETFDGIATKNVKEQFTAYVKRAFNEFIAEQVDARLKNALAVGAKKEDLPKDDAEGQGDGKDSRIVTTQEEWQAFYLVKSILMGTVKSERVVIRDAVSYCNVLLDNSNRKPLIRFYFNNPARLRIELFGDNKETTMHDIAAVDDILNHTDAIRATAVMYDNRVAAPKE
jgi:hypothetical protein